MSTYHIPRIMIAGTSSGCGKTTVTCAVMKALANRGLPVSPFKCGPDYIDPMFHTQILDTPSTNLDSFFFDENTLRYLLVKNSSDKGISVIEGVMGFYDGLEFGSERASSCEIARITKTPVILCVNAKGAALSLLAAIHGFLTFLSENYIMGVILNHCSQMSYRSFSHAILEHFGDQIKVLGYLPHMPECSLESRHLGLITAREVADLQEKTNRLSRQAEATIDLDGILHLARQADPIDCEPIQFPHFTEKIRIAAAMDNTFCFYYHDNFDLLREMGAEIIPFSPLTDVHLPEAVHGLYLGGGYPELYTQELSDNISIKNEIRKLLSSGIPCIAECGGFMYMCRDIEGVSMTNYFPASSYNNKKLTRFGYVTLEAKQDNLLCKKGEHIAAHEFHYWDCDDPGTDFLARKPSGREWSCIHANDHLYAGFPHIHFYTNPKLAENFYKACLNYKEKSHA